MKTGVIILLLGLYALSGRAQVKIVLLKDTTVHQLSRANLNTRYTSLNDLFRAKPAGLFDALRAHSRQFDEFIRKRPDNPQRGFSVYAHEYYQPDGHAQFVLVETDRPQPDSVLQQLLATLTDFYATTTYPASGPVPFRSTSALNYGKTIVPPRTVRRGAGIISTLEAARQTNRPDTVKMLAFNQLELTAIPDVIYRFPSLTELDLSKNALRQLPARVTGAIPTLKRLSLLYNAIPDDSLFFTRNKHLTALNVQGNKLTRVPGSVRLNRRLESLWLGNNNLATLDTKPLRRLHRLNDLNLYSVGLTTLPRSVGRLKHLRVLDLYYNKLTLLPRQIGRLKRLEQLALSHNNLGQLPNSLARLRRLQLLYAHHNRISQLPNDLTRARNLRVLDVSYNWFSVAPAILANLPALEELDLNNNNLQELPTTLGRLKNLKRLHLRSNPLTRDDAKGGPYAPLINELEANHTEVFY
ncbi:leucine-rich repeat domain-containing protein [Spirosoma rigui]|uniref:leucine-rich repeat domain-containing protein n=1 Tax=Spirosoma rigui TaxID=564064 RepID=UPI0009AF8BE5|nr:leucine-rich repeat domain-containing protein [Spirosoma rigui]